MNLVIDIGNTNVKWAIFENNKIIEHHLIHDFSSQCFQNILSKYSILIAVCVSNTSEHIDYIHKACLELKIQYMSVKDISKLPIEIQYATQDTLGSDRVALAVGAAMKYSGIKLIVDLGTCITYDFISSTKIYRGGAITPGFMMRYRSLNHYTSELPMLEFTVPKDYNGNSTFESIHSGIYYGIIDEIQGRIDFYKKKFKHLKVILTGGDSNKLPNRLKSGIFADSNFIGEGLLYLLKFNL